MEGCEEVGEVCQQGSGKLRMRALQESCATTVVEKIRKTFNSIAKDCHRRLAQ